MPVITHKEKTFCYESYGETTNPPLILISGISSQLINWPPALIDGLVEQGVRVIVFDNRDVGHSQYYDELETPDVQQAIAALQSGQPANIPYTLHDMAKDVVDLMDALHIKQAHVGGVSMGGMIAQLVALEFPERVLTLSLLETTSGDPALPEISPQVMELFFGPKPKPGDKAAYIEHRMKVLRVYNHPDDLDEAQASERVSEIYDRAHHPVGGTRQMLAIIATPPRHECLHEISCPTLVVHGNYDPCFSLPHGEQLAERIPNTTLVVIPNLGHGLPARVLPQMVKEISGLVKGD